MTKRTLPKLRTWRITDVHGELHEIQAHWLFKDNGGIVLRMKQHVSDPSEEVAMFAPGQWTSCIRKLDAAAEPEATGE